jgi:hypothetical protein
MEDLQQFHGQRCRVYTVDLPRPLVGGLAISKSGAMVGVRDDTGKDRIVLRASIKRVEPAS